MQRPGVTHNVLYPLDATFEIIKSPFIEKNYAGADHTTAYHNQPPAAVGEARHKAYHDGVRKADNVGAGDRHGGYAANAQLKADIETPKLPGVPAWHNKVGDDAYKYTARLQEPAAMDYHHYPTTNTTTALGRY
jgi:hypothetical protein